MLQMKDMGLNAFRHLLKIHLKHIEAQGERGTAAQVRKHANVAGEIPPALLCRSRRHPRLLMPSTSKS